MANYEAELTALRAERDEAREELGDYRDACMRVKGRSEHTLEESVRAILEERDEAQAKARASSLAALRSGDEAIAAIALVERYGKALEMIAAPKRADGTYNRCREACEVLARDALGPVAGQRGEGIQ